MAAFPLPAGHPFASVRPGYAGFESTPDGSVINATASYVGASGDYPANAITLQLFATQGGTWAVGTPAGLTVQTSPALNQAYTTAVYTGGLRGQTYTFTSISLTPAQGATLGWNGTVPSVTLTVPTNTTTIASGYYVGGNAGGIYLTPVLDSTLTPIVQGITNYFFVCTTSAAYASVDSIGTAIIPFPTGTTFTAGTTTSLDFTVQCRSNGILGQPSPLFTVGIVQPAVPSLTGVLSENNVNLTFGSTTPGCTFDLSYSGSVTATGITSPYSYTTTTPGAYTFQVRASLCGLTTFSLPSTTTILPAQPAGVTSTVSGLSISLAWTGLGAGYTYNVSGTGLATQIVSVPTAQFTNLQVGLPTFYIQSVYAGIRSTTCNVQVSILTTTPYNFRGSAVGATITLSWANDTPGATFTLSSSSPTTVATQNSLTTPSYTYTNVPGGSYSFTVVSTSAGIPSSPATVAGLVALSAPTNFAVTTLESTANLTWQNATSGASFNISYVVTSTLCSKAVVAGATTTSIPNLPAGNYTFGIQTLLAGASSSFVTAAATIIAAPTDFRVRTIVNRTRLDWNQSTPGCTFVVNVQGLERTGTASNTTYQNLPVANPFICTLAHRIGSAFVGPTVTITGIILDWQSSTPITSTLSGTNIDVSWPPTTQGTNVTYTLSSQPEVPNPPTAPGSLRSVTFVSPPPGLYGFIVSASDSSGNVSRVGGVTALVTVPVPQPTGVGLTMTASSQLTVTWTETLPGCTFTYQNGPTGVTPIVTNAGTSYTAVFNGVPLGQIYSPFTITATFNEINSLASAAVNDFRTFASFDVTLSATCSQSASTNNATATYTVNNPGIWNNVYGPPGQLANPVTVGFSGTALTPPISTAFAGYAGSYSLLWWGKVTGITNMIPTTFGQFVVPPTALTVTANGTNLLVKWTDSTTAGCRYTVVGTPGTFTSNVAAGTGSTGITFTNAAIGTAYTFIITASSAGTYTASRVYAPYGGSVVTTENATIPYTITSVSVPSTAVTPINFPATFTATATGTTIAINWGAVTGATGYTVYNSGTSLFTTTLTTCNYAGQAGTTYTLTVQANGASSSNTNPNSITVTPLAAPVITSIAQSGSNITVTSTGTGLSINTPAGLSAPTGTSTFNFTGASGNTTYSFTVTATGTNATSSATSAFTTLGTPAITSATAQGTATITVNWTYTGPTVTGFSVYVNNVLATSVGPSLRTAVFAQPAGINNTDTVYVVANGTVGSSVQSASVNVADLATPPTLTSSTVNALSFTVQWTYPTTARALSTFQVCNSTLTTLYSTVQYVANQLNYNSLFNVPSIAAYSFVIVGRDSVGSTISSAASTSVTPVAAPTITSVVQTGSTITLAATGSALSTPTVSPATLSTVSTSSPWAFSGVTANTLYTFTVQANGPGASNTMTCNITTLATPGIPTVSASGTTVTVGMPSYAGSPSFSVFVNPVPPNSWIQTSASADLRWYKIASSSDGTKLAAAASGNGIYTNASSGAGAWTKTSLQPGLIFVASSSNGMKLAAAIYGFGIYTNANSGAGDWTPTSAPSANWSSIASSSDGTKLVAGTYGGGIYNNATSGAGDWTPTSAPSANWISIASSSDGTKLAAVVYGGRIYTNASSGAGSWTQTSAPDTYWLSIASSSDGTKLVAGTYGGGIYTNASSGAGDWTPTSLPPANWSSIASSSDGTKLAAVVEGGGIYTNANSGQGNWTLASAPTLSWSSIASSSDGTKLVAGVVVSGGGIWRVDLSASPIPISVQGTSTTFTGVAGTTYSVSAVATIGANSSIASPSPLTSPLSAASGCILWLDGADPNNTGSPVANGTTITTWKDKSGNANDATIVSGTITVSGNNLVFGGLMNPKYLTVPGIAGTLVNTPFVIFVVETLGGPWDAAYFGDNNVNNNGAAGWSLFTGYANTGAHRFSMFGSSTLLDYSIIPQTGETRIWAMYLPSSANRNTRRNGNVDVTSTNNNRLQAFTAPRIGGAWNGSPYQGTIAEILVFPSDIGIPAIQRIEQYLANKWKVSAVSGVVTPLATPTAFATANGGTITVTCGTPAAGTVLNIPTTPTGLVSAYQDTTTTFTYNGAAEATTYSFSVFAYNGPARSSAGSTSVTTLYKPGKPTVTATGTTVTIAWTYGASPAGITFNVRDGNGNWGGTNVAGVLTTSFTAEGGKSYSIFVFATSGGNQSANSTSASITLLGTLTLAQNYQLTTQTKIVGTAAATGAATYSGTADSTNALSAATATGQTLTWTGATGGRAYTGVTIAAFAGAATSSLANQSLYSAFSPTFIAGCQVWYDGADPAGTGTPPADGAAVSTWVNRGSGGSAFNATKYSTYSAATYSAANRALSFNTTPIAVYSTGYTGTPTTETIFIVFNVTNPSVTNNTLIGGLASGGRGFGCGYTSAGAGTIGYLNMANEWQSTTSGYTSGTTMIATGQLASARTAVSLNGKALTTPTTYAAYSGNGTTYLGAQITGTDTYPYSGLAMEIIIYNTALTTIQRQLVERYLAWKWGLQTQLDPGFPLNNFPGTLPLPNTIAGLALWLDAADTTTITKNGVNLGSIKDKSGTNNSWTAGGSTATTFGTIGGLQCITFTGYSTSSITGTYSLTQGQNLTMFLAFNSLDSTQVDLFNDGPSIIFNRDGTLQLVNKPNYNLNYSSPANIPASANKTYVVAVTSTITNSTTASSFAVVNGTVYTMNANGYSFVSSGTSTFTASTIAYNPWSLGELVVYSGVLTNAQIQQVAGYLIYKWKAY